MSAWRAMVRRFKMFDLQLEQGTAVLTLSHATVNALSHFFMGDFNEALDRLTARGDIAVLHIGGSLSSLSSGRN